MVFLQNMSDDQTALLGCFIALVGAGLLMTVSYYLGQLKVAPNPVTHRLRQSRDERQQTHKAA